MPCVAVPADVAYSTVTDVSLAVDRVTVNWIDPDPSEPVLSAIESAGTVVSVIVTCTSEAVTSP